MLSSAADELPSGKGWQFEPKWDGFRTLVFRDGDEIFLQSRDEKSLNRYFPELVEPLRAQLPARCVLDGEIVIANHDGLDFEALQLRIHPAASRVKKLAAEHPAMLVIFDLLATERGASLVEKPLAERRERLEKFAARYFTDREDIRLSPATTKLKTAKSWFKAVGGNLDGIIAKRLDLAYRFGLRDVDDSLPHVEDKIESRCEAVCGLRCSQHQLVAEQAIAPVGKPLQPEIPRRGRYVTART